MPAKTPEQCDELFSKYLNEGNVDGVVSLYEPHASLVLKSGAIVRGADEIRKTFEPIAALRPRLTLDALHAVSAGDDLALVYNDWTFSATQPDGSPIRETGKALEVVRRQKDGTWRIVIDDPSARSGREEAR